MSQTIANLTAERDRFLAFVQRRIQDRALAEDILQTAYARAISQAETLKSAERADAWFFRILRNAIIDHYRHRAVEDRTFADWTPETEHPVSPPDTPANLCRCMNKAIDELQSSYRGLLQEVDLEETPLKDFALRSGITPGAAAVRAHRARRALHQQLLHSCGACAESAGCLDCTCQS